MGTGFRTAAVGLSTVLLLASCDSGSPPDRRPLTAPASSPLSSQSPNPPPHAPGCKVTSYTAPRLEPRYDMNISVDPRAGVASGVEDVSFTPDRKTSRVVFRLWPNGPRQRAEGNRLRVTKVTTPHPVAVRRPDPTTLIVLPRDTLSPRHGIEVHLRWRLRLGGASKDRLAADTDSLRLGSFFPILAWNPGRGWATDPPTSVYAEAGTSPTAHFHVHVDVPHGWDLLATGNRTGPDTFEAPEVRDFAMSVGHFDVASGLSHGPQPVHITVGVQKGLGLDPTMFLTRERMTLASYALRFGPYPWRSFTLAVTPDLEGSGIEYPNFVFQGDTSLVVATAHEMAHQWFYSLVGNDQARDPWLDEALATYAGATQDRYLEFLRERFPVPADARGHLGSPMTYWEQRYDDYFPGVYVQGALLLASLGSRSLVDRALRIYVSHNAYGIATDDDLIGALRCVIPKARSVLAGAGVH